MQGAGTRTVEHTRALLLVGLRARGLNGARIGRVRAVLVDRADGAPLWLQLQLPGYGELTTACPLHEITSGSGQVHVPWERSRVLGAPRVPVSGILSPRMELDLYRAYGLAPPPGRALQRWERRATAGPLLAAGRWAPAARPAPALSLVAG